jgi:hypothetical protein
MTFDPTNLVIVISLYYSWLGKMVFSADRLTCNKTVGLLKTEEAQQGGAAPGVGRLPPYLITKISISHTGNISDKSPCIFAVVNTIVQAQ